MCADEKITAEAIAELCFRKYKELPKTGKPTAEQWSVLAGIILHDSTTNRMRVVSIGLGTKCIGASQMCKKGLIINDSHAEVLARRGLLRFIYNELRASNSTTSEDSIFKWHEEDCLYELKSNYSFHFFCTQPPCGDGCIVAAETLGEEEPPAKQRKLSDGIEDATIYTSAKLIVDDDCDAQRDLMAQTLGAIRLKPGKGDRTLSMSCSDKLSKWCVMGIQGALIDTLLSAPIYLSSINFCSPANLEALERAIYKRFTWSCNLTEINRFRQHVPLIQICQDASIIFECQKTASRKQPAPTGISWCDVPINLRPCEILVSGSRQGCTKTSLGTPKAALLISKFHLFQQFHAILSLNEELKRNLLQNQSDVGSLSYRNAKDLARKYQHAWNLVKLQYFRQWTKKPEHFEQFCCT